MPTCPNLVDGLCRIYESRPQCCRNFPNREHPNCIDAYRCDLNCKDCVDKCCNHILLTDEGFVQSLNIECDSCKQTWS
jgi:hypothetical protein